MKRAVQRVKRLAYAPIPPLIAMTLYGPAHALPLQVGRATATAISPAAVIDQLADCRAHSDDAQRLACFDRTVIAVMEARRKKDIVILDRDEVRTAKTSLFGFSLPSIKLFGGGSDDEHLKQLKGIMVNSAMLPGGLMRFELADARGVGIVAKGGDNKSVWETVEQVMSPPRRGDEITIKSGALGSYVASAPGRRSARVRRIR